jgi:hypothetical protein
MGGPGSGNWYRWDKKATVAECRRIDVRDFQRRGLLRPGISGKWGWSRAGETVASIDFAVVSGRLVLSYRVRPQGGEWESITEPVPLTWTPCNYGGQRAWFLCPGVVNDQHCGRRVAMLYGSGRYFLCRHCYNLVYETQQEDSLNRARLKLQRLHRRLGGEGMLFESLPAKPKGMHWRTYFRLYDRAIEVEEALSVTFTDWIARADARASRIIARAEERQRRAQRYRRR